MGKITKYLNQLIVGDVFDTPEVLEEYSIDRSVLKIKPKFVAFPESTDDIQRLVRFFDQLSLKDIHVPVTVRGSGLDESGADLSNGVVISTKRLNRMLEIDPRERLVRVQAGITLKELNTALSVSGLAIPVEGHDNETIGGLISNCPRDTASGKYGGIYNYVERIEAVLGNGECLQTNRLKKYALAKKAAEKTPEGEIYRKIAKILKDNEGLVNDLRNGQSMAGYPKICNVKKRETVDLMPLFFGAQGTLGIISEVILKAAPAKNKTMRVVATFKDIGTAVKFMDSLKPLNPRELNLYDLAIVGEAREAGKNLDGVIKRIDEGFTVLAVLDERLGNVLKKINIIRDQLPRGVKFVVESSSNKQSLDELGNALPRYLNDTKKGERVPVLTDFYLPEWNVGNFLNDIKLLGEKLELELELFGSYSSSIYNLRPKFDLEDKDFNKKVATFLKAGAYVIERQNGVLAGGAPEGRLKAVVTNENIAEPERALYTEIKKIFDRNNVLNSDVKLGAVSKFTLTHFRDSVLPNIMI